MGPGGNTARVSALAAGLEVSIPGMTIDRQCGSGLSAIVTAATLIRAGDAHAVIAGGAESASTAPLRVRDGQPYERAPFAPAGFPDPDMLGAAEVLRRRFGITRAEQDAYAVRSHAAAALAIQQGRYDDELVGVGGVLADDGPCLDLERMIGRFPPLRNGAVNAGNSCRVSDGAAAVALVSDEFRESAPGLRLVASGSGKSTFARLLNALARPTSGVVRVHGLDTVKQTRELRRRVGFIFSNPDAQIVMPTVAEDVAYSLRGGSVSKPERAQLVEVALERFGLVGLRDAPAHLLSGGQKQLLALCAVLVSEPSLVVADEPTALLDAVNSRRMANYLLDEMEQQLVLVTHDMRLASRCDVAIRFDNSRLVDCGDPSAVIDRYEESLR
jgi:biotin transport system ATP-binding protein